MKPGYKQTEVGVIPEEWEVKPFAELFAFRNGVNADKAAYGQGVRFINVLEPITYSHIRGPEITGQVTLPEAIIASYAVRRGDVLFNRTSETQEEVALAAIYLGAERVVFGGFVIRGRPLAENFDPVYAGYALRAPCIRSQIIPMGQGAVRANVGQQNLGRVLAPLPSLPEQRAIASALSDVDGLLGGLDRLIAKKRDLKQAAMQQLLTGQTRLPGFHAEWEVKTLYELAERKKEFFDDGDWIESEHITTEGIRLIQTGNIGVGSFVEKDDKKYINEASFSSLRCKQLKQGDLLVCRLADPAGRACVLGDIGEERIVTSVDVTIFRPPSELADRLFLSQVFSTSDWFRAVSDRSGGTTHKRISRGALGRLSIKLPPLPEQTAIASVLTEMDAELAALTQRREKTRALKQAMMQELLTGRTRLV